MAFVTVSRCTSSATNKECASARARGAHRSSMLCSGASRLSNTDRCGVWNREMMASRLEGRSMTACTRAASCCRHMEMEFRAGICQ